jgi:hypothetical protein
MTPIQENVGLFVVGLDGDGAAEEIPFYHTARLVSSVGVRFSDLVRTFLFVRFDLGFG